MEKQLQKRNISHHALKPLIEALEPPSQEKGGPKGKGGKGKGGKGGKGGRGPPSQRGMRVRPSVRPSAQTFRRFDLSKISVRLSGPSIFFRPSILPSVRTFDIEM